MGYTGRQPGRAISVQRLSDPFVLSLQGDANGHVTIDASQDVTINTAVQDDSHNHVIGNVDGLQSTLDLKAPLASPTFTGTVVLPSTTSIGNIDATEISYLDGVTSAIQTQLNAKVAAVSSTDNAIVRFDGTTGSVQNSTAILDDSGNLGLGVTPSAWGSGRSAFEGSFGGLTFDSNVLGTVLTGNSYYNGTNWVYKFTGINPTYYKQVSGQHQWYTAPYGTAGNPITFTQAMTLDASGNLWVGLTNGVNSRFYVSNPNIAQLVVGYNNTGVNYYDADTQIFRSGGSTERMRLDASGNLLVGTTTQDSGAKFTLNDQGVVGLSMVETGTASHGRIYFKNGNGVVGQISTIGTATSFVTSSDYRLKENVAPLTNALDTIAALKPCTFTWKADGSADRGFIAHELQEVIPQAVSGEKDAVDDEGNIMPQGVDYGKITPELVAAIQEQQAMITELKARIEQLENK